MNMIFHYLLQKETSRSWTTQHSRTGTFLTHQNIHNYAHVSRSLSHRPFGPSRSSVRFSSTVPLKVEGHTSRQKPSSNNHNQQNHFSMERTTSTSLLSSQKHYTNVLDLRGKCYDQNTKAFDVISYLKEKSIPRRIKRLISEPSNKSLSETGKNDDRSSLVSEDMFSGLGVGFNNKKLLERRKGLHLRRSMNKSEVSEKKFKLFLLF